MSSPFPPNATITFLVPTGEPLVTDLGDPAAFCEEWVVEAYLKRAKSKNKSSDSANAGEMPRTFLEGRIVAVLVGGVEQEIAALPASVLPGSKGILELRDNGELMGLITGDFFLDVSVASAFGTSAALGAPIEGYYLGTVNWGEAL